MKTLCILTITALILPATTSSVFKISFSDLKTSVGDDRINKLEEVLKDQGVIAVTNIAPHYESAVRDLQAKAPDCLRDSAEFNLPDGSVRKTFATSSETNEVFPECIRKESEVISETFENVYEIIAKLLTTIAGEENVKWTTPDNNNIPKNLTDLEEKEHVHVYRPGNTTDTMMVPYHTDNGMLLMITPFKKHSLLVKNKLGTEADTADVSEDSVLVMVARGLTDWLLKDSSRFYPVPHAVRSLGKETATRTVFARMKVPPMNAVPSGFTKDMTEGSETFDDMNERSQTFQDFFTGISTSSERSGLCPVTRLSFPPESSTSAELQSSWQKLKAEECTGNTSYCWMDCLDLPPACPSADQAHCSNAQDQQCCTEDITDNCAKHDTSCIWKCNENPTDRDFCNGQGTDMYMEGFTASGNGKKACVILLFESWILDTRLKFAFGCLGVIVLGIFVEFQLYLRRQLQGRRNFLQWMRNSGKKLAIILLFGLNLASGYFAMLVAMTYSVELFVCMVVGLVIGHAIFNSSSPVGETVDPCCASQRNPIGDSSEELKPSEDCEKCNYGSLE